VKEAVKGFVQLIDDTINPSCCCPPAPPSFAVAFIFFVTKQLLHHQDSSLSSREEEGGRVRSETASPYILSKKPESLLPMSYNKAYLVIYNYN
jgi:hypothetical protein